uniref:Polyketide synthase n=1 Tax=Peronospora matthiolae TaxID=2874970 RepID=A0AAV1TSE9_9STRA
MQVASEADVLSTNPFAFRGFVSPPPYSTVQLATGQMHPDARICGDPSRRWCLAASIANSQLGGSSTHSTGQPIFGIGRRESTSRPLNQKSARPDAASRSPSVELLRLRSDRELNGPTGFVVETRLSTPSSIHPAHDTCV